MSNDECRSNDEARSPMIFCGRRCFVIRHSQRVRQFHDVEEISLAPPDVQNVHESFVGTGNWLELLDAIEFALEWAVMIEALPIHNFHGAASSHHVAGQPDFAVAATADPAN